MKKYLLIILAIVVVGALIFASCNKASAEEITLSDWLKKIPNIHQCFLYNVTDSEFGYASTVTVASLLKEKINIDVGYSPAQEVIGAVSVKLVEVKDYIKYPILDLLTLEPMFYVGWDRLSIGPGNSKAGNEFSYGFGVKILDVKF